jgi:hypothetical protein
MSAIGAWVAHVWLRVRARVSGEVLLDDEQRAVIAHRDVALQRDVEQDWITWNDAHRAGPRGDVIGICCSGGGLRSAAFSLGALQQLRAAGVLDEAAWMSAVSGGSYIAAAHYLVQADFSPPVDTDTSRGRSNELAEDGSQSERDAQVASFTATPAYAIGSPEERWLRTHSSYMADGWLLKLLLAGQVLFGSALILLAVVAVLTLFAIPAGVAGVALFPDLASDQLSTAEAAVVVGYNPWTRAGLVALAGALACAVGVVGFRLSVKRRAIVRRVGYGFAAVAIVLLAYSWVLPRLALALRVVLTSAGGADADELLARLAALGGLLGLSPLIVTAFGVLVRSIRDLQPVTRSRILRTMGPRIPTVVAAIAAPILFAAISLYAYNWTTLVTPRTAWTAFGICAAVLGVYFLVIDPTSTSMHTFYKRRLASAFDVERIPGDTGRFDGVRMRDSDVRTTLSQADVEGMPKLVVAAAANISTSGATPTGRNAVPFTFSSDWIGGREIGWIATTELEERLRTGTRRSQHMLRDITLLAAVAMSGAAVSPAMGKMTKPAYRILLTLANARLGVWLPNPRYSRSSAAAEAPVGHAAGPEADRPAGPRSRPALGWLFREMAGLMSQDARRIYVTDGGHYENLGLIELLRRRCTVIYCFDASGDPPDSFTTLAQTLAIARTDLGVDIPADPVALRSHANGPHTDWDRNAAVSANGDAAAERPRFRKSHAVIPFTYPPDAKVAGQSLDAPIEEQQGTLIYVKCRVTGSAPWDVRALYERDPAFPDHSTADQLYTEERLEAYRALGAHLTRDVLSDSTVKRRARHLTRRRPRRHGSAHGTPNSAHPSPP